MSVLDNLLARLAPHTCIGCGDEAGLLCAACAATIKNLPARCYRCQTLSPTSRTCAACRRSSGLYRVGVAAAYEGLAKALLWKLKSSGVQAAGRSMAHAMRTYVYSAPVATYIVPIPTATSRVRQRGYDQAKLIAKELSRQTRLPYLDCLARSGQAHQVGASRAQRLGQIEGALRVLRQRAVTGRRIILVDDVLTTGATLEAAAKALLQAGAGRVEAVVYAQA